MMLPILDIRERLQFLADHPRQAAITREGILTQLCVLLVVAGVDSVQIEQEFLNGPINKDLALRVDVTDEDPWVQTIVARALSRVPNPCKVQIGIWHVGIR